MKSEPTRARYDPLALDSAPEVDALLGVLGLGAFDSDEVTSHVGRNDNWSGPTTSGTRVFVKRLGGPSPDDARRRFDRILAFETLRAHGDATTVPGPPFLGSDPDHLLVVFELLDDARSGAELTADDAFSNELCRTAGEITAALHNLPSDAGVLDTSPHPLPPLGGTRALPLKAYVDATFGELETWRLIQSDAELIAALHRLRDAETQVADRRPVHGDMRLDQFLFDGDRLYLTDYEEFRLGDPARDVGAFVGEWLYFAMRGIPKAVGQDTAHDFGHETSHEEILHHGARELERFQPRMAAFWTGYRSVRPDTGDLGFRARAAAYAGWHMIDRMYATALVGGRVPAADRACAGIGRTALLSPDSYTDVLGLGGTR